VGLGLLVAFVGATKVAGLLTGHDLALDQMLFRERLGIGQTPNRMAPNTAWGFVLIGSGLLALRLDQRGKGWWSQALASAALLLSFSAILGYAYGVGAFYRVTAFIPMALNTALAFLAFSLGLLVALPERGIAGAVFRRDPGGMMARRFLPLSALSIGVLGWLTLRGARAELYDQGFALCLFASLSIVVMAAITLRSAAALGRTDAARQASVEALRQAHGELEARVVARTADLLRANQELEREIAGRRRVEDEVSRERRFSSQIIESSVDGIAAFDRALRITAWNPGMERISGLSRERVLGRTASEAFPFIVRTGEVAHLEEALTGRPVTVRDRPFDVPETGRKGSFDGQFSPLLDESGAIVGGVAVVHETTGQKQLERRVLQVQKMEAVGRLAGGVAHDFNNLLTAILGYGQLLQGKLAPDDAARHDVEEILLAAMRGAGLTRQLLLFSRQQVVEFRVLDLNATVTGVDRMLRRLVGEDVDVVTAPSATPIRVRADAGQLEQVLMNLAVNARDAMPDGGKLTIETSTIALDGAYAAAHPGAKPGHYALLAVSDTGTGISPEVRAHLFEPFFTTKELGKGTGLGLSTVHGIVSGSDGHVDVYTQLGQGTTFKVYLPLVEEPAEAQAPGPRAVEPTRGSETVLLAEDEEPLRRMMRTYLVLQGYTVLEAADGSEAIGICERRDLPIDLLVTDVVMPLMNGPDLVRRATLVRPALRVLYMSGYTDRALVHQELREGTTAFIQKPFMPEALAHKIRKVLDQPARTSE
jgi:PAS domain S-box-containing protein